MTRKLIILPFIILLTNSLYSQTNWKDYLVYDKSYEWDSTRCKQVLERFDTAMFSHPEVPIFIKGGFDTLALLIEYPDVPKPFQVDGKVWFRFIVTKESKVECLTAHSGLSEPYIQAAVDMFKNLEFTAASNRNVKVAYQFILPIAFQRPGIKTIKWKKEKRQK